MNTIDGKTTGQWPAAGLAAETLNEKIEACSNAIKLKPDYAEAYCNRGSAYYIKGQYSEAFRDFSKAIELNPDYTTAYNNRGLVYYYKRQYDEAIKDYSKAIELKPDYAEAYNNRGFAYGKINKWAEKIDDHKKVLSFGVDENGKTKNGKFKSDYEIWIKEAEENIRIEVKARVNAIMELQLKVDAEAEAIAKAEEEKRLTALYNAAKRTNTFDSSVLKYLHSYDESSMSCEIPEWAERVTSYTATADNSWIKALKIGRNVTVIENDAFRGCPNLERIDFSESAALSTIEKNAFADCDKLRRVGLPKTCKVQRGAFPKKCKIEKIDVKVSVQPFYANNMSNVPVMPVVTDSIRERIGFDTLNESVAFGADIRAEEFSVIGSTSRYANPSMVTSPLNDNTTMRGGFGDSIL